MSVAIVTGSCGLVGSEAVRFLSKKGFVVVGIDNDMRSHFFGEGASTVGNRNALHALIKSYTHVNADIRDGSMMEYVFRMYGKDTVLVIHAAAQPSHDWAARDPSTDFEINALGTLNLLKAARKNCPDAVFIHCSTNKVYGDVPNELTFLELPTRWDVGSDHPCWDGINEQMRIDRTTHSLFGVSKASADLLVQEYGQYFCMKTACFRGGCLTGPAHTGAPLHGFLAYLIQCAVTDTPYEIIGYKGKQVRDNIHASDLLEAFWAFFKAPRVGEVYNIGGGRASNCSVIEAIAMAERLTGRPMITSYVETPRVGDHKWWISDMTKFRSHYPGWAIKKSLTATVAEIYQAAVERAKTAQ